MKSLLVLLLLLLVLFGLPNADSSLLLSVRAPHEAQLCPHILNGVSVRAGSIWRSTPNIEIGQDDLSDLVLLHLIVEVAPKHPELLSEMICIVFPRSQ